MNHLHIAGLAILAMIAWTMVAGVFARLWSYGGLAMFAALNGIALIIAGFFYG